MEVASRHVRNIRPAVVLFALVLLPRPLLAQTVIDGQRVEFLPSADHNTDLNGVPAVRGYTLSLYLAGSGTVAAAVDLGKPAPDPDGSIRVAWVPLLAAPLQMGVNYEARVSADGPGGSSASEVSNAFLITSMCGTSTLGSTSASVGASAAVGTVGVTTACAWGSVSNASWITVTSGASGTTNGTLGYAVSANTTITSRSGTLTIAGKTFTVNQAGATCSYSLAATSQAMSVNGGTGSVAVTSPAGCAWTAGSHDAWLTVTSGATGNGPGSVGFKAAPNNQTSLRSGTLTIAGATFTVTETACGYALTPTSQSISSGGGPNTVTVSTGAACPWTAASNASWINVTSGASGSGNGTVGYTAAGDTGASGRSGTLTIAGHPFTVTESGCSYTVSPTSLDSAFPATSGTVTVTTSSTCVWGVSSSAGWMTLSGGGTGSGTATYTLSANSAPNSRTTTVVVAGQTVSVAQAGATKPTPPTNLRIIK